MTLIVTGGADFIGSNFVFCSLDKHPKIISSEYQYYYEKKYGKVWQ